MTRFRHAIMIGAIMTGALALSGLALAPLAAQTAAQPDIAADAESEAAPMTAGEKQLAKLLDGRVAGEPVRCIRAIPRQRVTTISGEAYVYGAGRTIYVQRTRDPAAIDADDSLISNRFTVTQLCRSDVMRTVNLITGIYTGAVFFEDFVPYTRVKDETGTAG